MSLGNSGNFLVTFSYYTSITRSNFRNEIKKKEKERKITLQFCLPETESLVHMLHEGQAQALLVHHCTHGEDPSAWHVAVIINIC